MDSVSPSMSRNDSDTLASAEKVELVYVKEKKKDDTAIIKEEAIDSYDAQLDCKMKHLYTQNKQINMELCIKIRNFSLY